MATKKQSKSTKSKKSKEDIVSFNVRLYFNKKTKQFEVGFVHRAFKVGQAVQWKDASNRDRERIISRYP